MNLVESKPILKIEKEKQGGERQQFNIKRNELVEKGEHVPFSDAKYDYVIKKNQVVKDGVVYDNLDNDLDNAKVEKKQEIESNFGTVQICSSQETNEALSDVSEIFGYKKNSNGLIVFNSGISKFEIDALLYYLASQLPESFEHLNHVVNLKKIALNILSTFNGLLQEDRPIVHFIRNINIRMNENILNKKKKTELLAQLEVATTLEEVQAIDVEKAKQEVQIELAGLTGLNGVEGVEGL